MTFWASGVPGGWSVGSLDSSFIPVGREMTLGSGAGSTKELATWGDVMFWKRRWNDPTMIQNSGAAVKWLQEYVAHRWRWVTPERPGETVKPWLHSHATVQHCTGQIAGENGSFLHSRVLLRAVFTASCQPKQFVWQALGQCGAVGHTGASGRFF